MVIPPRPPGRPPRKSSKTKPAITAIKTGLIDAIEKKISSGDPVGILLVDEEESSQSYPESKAQLQVLEYGHKRCLPIIALEINPSVSVSTEVCKINTRPEFLPFIKQVVHKKHLNGFDEFATCPDLLSTLRLHDLYPDSSLVFMGYAMEQCVRLTAVGGKDRERPGYPLKKGAHQYGYRIMTCLDILRTAQLQKFDPSWVWMPRVEYYQSL